MAEHSPNTLAREEKATTTASAYRLIRRTRHTVRHPQRSRMKRKKKKKKHRCLQRVLHPVASSGSSVTLFELVGYTALLILRSKMLRPVVVLSETYWNDCLHSRHLLRDQSSQVLCLKSGAGPHTAMYDFFLADFYSPGPFTCIFSTACPEFLWCSLWRTPVPVWVPEQNRSPCSSLQTTDSGPRVVCLRNINRLQNICYCFSGLAFRNCGCNYDYQRELLMCYVKYEVCCVVLLFLWNIWQTVVIWWKATCVLTTSGLNSLQIDWSLFSVLIKYFVVEWAQITN